MAYDWKFPANSEAQIAVGSSHGRDIGREGQTMEYLVGVGLALVLHFRHSRRV